VSVVEEQLASINKLLDDITGVHDTELSLLCLLGRAAALASALHTAAVRDKQRIADYFTKALEMAMEKAEKVPPVFYGNEKTGRKQ